MSDAVAWVLYVERERERASNCPVTDLLEFAIQFRICDNDCVIVKSSPVFL